MRNSRLAFIFALAAATAITACNSERDQKTSAMETVRGVAVVKAESARLPDDVPALGTVRAKETAQISAQIMGVVTSVLVHEGDAVKQGQTLVLLDAGQPEAGLQRAEAALSGAQHELAAARSDRELADSTLKRYTTLYERKSVSPQEFDEVKTRQAAATARAEAAQDGVTQAKAAVAQAQTTFNYTRIRAPFDGRVVARTVDPGSMASPGTPLLTIESTGQYRAEVSVNESNLQFVKIGNPVAVSLDAYPEEGISGRVSQIVPSADPLSRTFLVKIDLPAMSSLRSGLSATAHFSRGTRDATTLPKSAVVDRGAMKAVYVVGNDGVASLRYVTTGSNQQDRIEILSGLTARETVIASPTDREFGGK